MYLLDTNTLIYFFKGMGQVAQRLLSCAPQSIAVSSITVFELKVGILKSQSPDKRSAQLDALLEQITVIGFAENEAEVAAKIRADLEKTGTPIGPLDTLIAATALAHNATLITHNLKEFTRVNGLKVESWLE